MKLLCLSNGHGEDVIAAQILEQLQSHPKGSELELAALPLVGEGYAYSKLNIPIVGRVQQMPSGGFVYMDGRQLLRDVQSGLFRLTLEQYKTIRKWANLEEKAIVLAVGDIVPLIFAWASGADYAFVGTAKSEYYLRSETGWLSKTSLSERWLGSVYYPWERWLMSRSRCRAVFPRDKLTTEILQQWSIPAFDLGNPMMDGISAEYLLNREKRENKDYSLTILLLPGSRSPEALRNWQKIIEATAGIISTFSETKLVFLGAIAPALSIDPFQKHLIASGWNFEGIESINNKEAIAFTQKNATLLLSQNAYKDCLLAADMAIAMAGTATEQFVGLGKPVIIIPGEGPQFTYAFAEAQTRLLGCSTILVQQPDLVASSIKSLLNNLAQRSLIAENGRRRMGNPGAAKRIAQCLVEEFFLDRSQKSMPRNEFLGL